MATATEVIANETEIANAIGVLRQAGLDDDLLDKIELDRRLKISEEQFERGETLTVEELKKRTAERLNNGYYLRLR